MAVVKYNGSNNQLSLRDRLALFMARDTTRSNGVVSLEALEGKSLPLQGSTYAANLPTVRWSASTPLTYFGEGYRLNSAVFACARTLAQAFAEAPLTVYRDASKEDQIPDHPLRKLISRPNPWMGEDEFWRYWILYASVTGNAYGYLVPTRGGGVGEIWPYSDLFITPVDSPTEWIDHYEYSTDNGLSKVNIPVEQVVHYKYVPDPFYPMRGMGALRPVAREVDSDNELTRYLKSLFQNDAVPRGVLSVPPGVAITKNDKEEAKQNFKRLFGGDNRGDVAVFDKGLTYTRMSLDMGELAFDALQGCARSTYSVSVRRASHRGRAQRGPHALYLLQLRRGAQSLYRADACAAVESGSLGDTAIARPLLRWQHHRRLRPHESGSAQGRPERPRRVGHQRVGQRSSHAQPIAQAPGRTIYRGA
jgi:hypothetical protein